MDLPSEAELSEDNSTLTLTPFAWTSVGVYTCVAENIVGQAHAQAEVRAMSKDVWKMSKTLVHQGKSVAEFEVK